MSKSRHDTQDPVLSLDHSPSLDVGLDEPSTSEIVAALESSGVVITLLDVDTRIVYLSMYRELQGQLLKDRMTRESRKRFLLGFERVVVESVSLDLELCSDPGDGDFHWFDCHLTPWIRGDEVVGVLMSSRLIDDARRARIDLAQFRALLDAADEMIVIADAETGAVLDVNEAVSRSLGYQRKDLASMPMWMLGGEGESDESGWVSQIARAEVAGGSSFARTHLRKANGDLLEVEVSLVVHALEGRRYALSLIRDITSQVGTERRLAQVENRFREIAAAIPGVVYQIVLSKTGQQRLSYVSESARQFFGFDPDALIGMDPTLLMAPPQKEAFDRATRVAADNALFLDETLELNAPNGQSITVRVSSRPVKLPSGETEFNGVLLDVSDRTRLESRMHEMQKMEAVGRIAGSVAHDFNNVLTAILSCTAIAASDLVDDSPIRQELDLINTAAGRAAELTRQLLTFAREQSSEPQVVATNELLSKIEPMLVRLVGEGHEFVTKLAGDLPAIKVDPGQLEQVLINLVVNACDALERAGKVVLESSLRDIDDSIALDVPGLSPGRYVAVTISDTGVGMSRDVREKIFEPFFTTKETGTGLGLASCYGIIRQAGGHIEVDSEPGRGARFHVLLPAQSVAPDGRSTGKMPALRVGGSEYILLVEDDPILRKVVARSLSRLGYQVRAAADGHDAIAIIAKEAAALDLVLTDMVLPGANGAELARTALDLSPSLKVLFVSGYGDLEVAEELKATGRVDFLPKPFSPPELAFRVREILDDPA